MDSGPGEEGRLELKQKSGWTTVHVKLYSNILSYSVISKVGDLQEIDLSSATILSDPSTPTYKKNCFEVITEQNGDKETLLFSAKSEYSKIQWLSALVLAQKVRGEPKQVNYVRRASAPDLSDMKKQSTAKKEVPPDPSYDVRFEKEKMKLKRMVNKIDSKRVPAPPLAEVKKAKSSTFGKHSSKNMVKEEEQLPDDDHWSFFMDICSLWGRPFDQHPVDIDFPRVCRQMILFNRDINVIQMSEFPDPLYNVDENSLTEEGIRKLTAEKCKHLLCLLSHQLRETNLTPQIQQSINGEGDPAVQLKSLFTAIPTGRFETVKILKLTHHLTLVTPYLTLKKKFSGIGFVLKEQSGFWKIQVVFKVDEIHILHEKKSASGNDAPEEKFEFVWNLQIISSMSSNLTAYMRYITDAEITQIKNVKLTLSELEINPKVPEEKKQKIRSIIALYAFH